MNMKYLEKYIEDKLKIKILGKLTTRESNSGEEVGVSLVIDGYEPGIEVWYVDYAKWLEEKIENSHYKNMFSGCEKPNINKMTLEEFRDDVLTAMKNKPKGWRDGQFVFNHIDVEYGVARSVQFIDGVDCFYDDSKIEEFITRSYEYIKNIELSDNY